MTQRGHEGRDAESLPDPPGAPEITRRLSLYRWQVVGMLLIAAIPVAAIAGVFGDSWTTRDIRTGMLHATARIPSVLRYKTVSSITLHVRNDGAAMVDSVHVSVDTAYIARFSTVTATPPFSGSYSTFIAPLQPHSSTLITIELQAEEYGRHSGNIVIRAGPDSARITFATLVLP